MEVQSIPRHGLVGLLAFTVFACTPTEEQVELSSEDGAKQELRERGIEYNGQAYAQAVASGDIEATRLFLQAGMDVDETPGDETALAMICSSSSPEMVRFLVDNGADPNGKSTTGAIPICRAALSNSLETAEILLDAGANPNAAFNEPNFVEDGQRTALMLASSRGHLEMARLLVERGAQVDTSNEEGETALSLAIKNGHAEIQELLEAAL